ncbi:class I SAM-dependent methyltransferase [Vacuolonema iberomarrocanum]|uniref:class I SAM-dependent methyltransferase n=1 Tax=Vacuolonema iberomarrocanum TaxID=3454632 RepID=UPI0019F4CBFB|nr:class I SAM-dependent methyltransferase [filamentous cyanobacterium LEGE 07170]
MDSVSGTRGYEDVIDAFIEVSQALDFAEINKDFLDFLPPIPSCVLDAGAGAGQNAAALARMGYSVVAVEPFAAFLDAGRSHYKDLNITWIQDSLPLLQTLGDSSEPFDFILVDGVWHHLDEEERERCMARFSTLLSKGGVCAMSLRHGPAGAGKHVFPTDGQKTALLARRYGLRVALHLTNQPSKMRNKPGVTWTRMVFRLA